MSVILVLFLILYFWVSPVLLTSSYKFHNIFILERVECVAINKSLIQILLKITPYNRTAKVLNGKFRLNADLAGDSTVYIKAYQFKSNTYRLTAIQFPLKIRQVFKMDIFGVDMLFKGAQPPMGWPLRTGITYNIVDWLPESKKFLNVYRPAGKWMAEVSYYIDNGATLMCTCNFYLRAEEVPDF